MKKNFFIIKKLLVMFFVISHTYVCGMEKINEQQSFTFDDIQTLNNIYKTLNNAHNRIIAHNSVSRSQGYQPRTNFKSNAENSNKKVINNPSEIVSSFSAFFSGQKCDNKIYLKKFYQEESALASEYNRKNILLSLPNEIVYSILAYSVDTAKSLEDTIKPCLELSTICKKFNTTQSLIAVGKSCFSYDIAEKNSVMKQLLSKTNNYNYKNVRHQLFLLTYAGADNTVGPYSSLLYCAIHRADKQMITALFNNNVSPNQQGKNNDIDFFRIKTIDIAQMFIDRGVDVNAREYCSPNVLWFCLSRDHSLELIEFYLKHNVDAKKINIGNNECIFHHFARIRYRCIINIEDYAQIGTLLLKVAPEIINTLNKDGKTPLDIVKEIMKVEKQQTNAYKLCVALVELFEKHGGKTAEQLKQDEQKRKQELRNAKSEKNENSDCIICFGKSDTMMHIPCPNVHPERICVGCYNSLLKFSNNCPLCRTALS